MSYRKSVFDAINDRDVSKIVFYQYELSVYENIGDV